MRLLVTADLHYNHAKSKPLADELIERMNRAGGDVLLVVGDTATTEGDALERCLSRFEFSGPKLFVAGNHELWTRGGDSYAIYTEELPRRVRELGWQWLETDPFVTRDLAIVGSVGWYDFSFAQQSLGIPTRFYERKISPGAATDLKEFADLFDRRDDIAPHAMEIFARWNAGRFVNLGRSDVDFLRELLERLASQLDARRDAPRVIVATHHLPFAELLPPPRTAQWDFAKAYLGSAAIGGLLAKYPNITHAICGHSHFPAETRIGSIQALNVGSGYRWKTFHVIE